MNHTSLLQRLRRCRAGFNLIEVSLALAVVAVGMMGILGILPNAYTSARDAADSTIISTILLDLTGEARRQPFTRCSLPGWNVTPRNLGSSFYSVNDINNRNAFFSQAGNYTHGSTVAGKPALANNPNDYFRVTYYTQPYDGTALDPAKGCYLVLVAEWPVQGNPTFPRDPKVGTALNVVTNMNYLTYYDQ